MTQNLWCNRKDNICASKCGLTSYISWLTWGLFIAFVTRKLNKVHGHAHSISLSCLRDISRNVYVLEEFTKRVSAKGTSLYLLIRSCLSIVAVLSLSLYSHAVLDKGFLMVISFPGFRLSDHQRAGLRPRRGSPSHGKLQDCVHGCDYTAVFY